MRAIREQAFDIVFMDVQMPEMGLVVAMTAFAMQGDRERCIEAGMNDYITKPVSVKDLQCAVSKWCMNDHLPKES